MSISWFRRHKKSFGKNLSIPDKANRILNILLIIMGFIVMKIWHLAVVQHDDKLEEIRKPRERVIMEPAARGTIRDRFNIPLATNKMSYHAAVVYAQFRNVPSVCWEYDSSGKRVKHYRRKEHIGRLAQLLGTELGMDVDRVEDLIYSKAAFYYQRPFVIKENITEQQYYRLKILEKDWEGLHVLRAPQRAYPFGRVGANVIGYMGAINREEYESIIGEKRELEWYLRNWESGENSPLPKGLHNIRQVKERYKELQERAYTINDYLGKTGIEGQFEETLRGFQGKQTFYSDARGNFLRELPGTYTPMSGQRVMLTLSAELQEYAERLLAENERIRDGRSTKLNRLTGTRTSLRQPWIKGGAIVVMEPFTGEVLALASCPRFDPNDFVFSGDPDINRKKQTNILRWFETESYIQEIWDGKRPLEREGFVCSRFVDEAEELTWDHYLHHILPEDHPIRRVLAKFHRLEDAVLLQNTMDVVIRELGSEFSPVDIINAIYPSEPHVTIRSGADKASQETLQGQLKEQQDVFALPVQQLNVFFEGVNNNYDKLLLIDLCRLNVDNKNFTKDLLRNVGHISLSDYHSTCCAFGAINNIVHTMAKELFHEIHFKQWRQQHGQAFLKKKRHEEKTSHRYTRPYIDLFDVQERQMFQQFWKETRWGFLEAFLLGKQSLLVAEEYQPYIDHFIAWSKELSQGAHRAVSWYSQYQALQEVIAGLPSSLPLGYFQTMRSYQELTRPLLGNYRYLRKDEGVQREKHLAAAFYPAGGFGYGLSQAYQQSTPQGSIFKIVTAYEALMQRYHKMMEQGFYDKNALNPLEIIDQVTCSGSTWYVGSWLNGEPIPRSYKGGSLPRSYQRNLGRMDLIRAIETSGNPYFSILAGDVINDPEDLVTAARQFSYGSRTGIDLPGEISGHLPTDLKLNRTGLYSFAIGHHSLVVTPLQAAVMFATLANGGQVLKPQIVKLIAGNQPVHRSDQVLSRNQFTYQDDLSTVGIDFPLFTAAEDREQQSGVHPTTTVVKREVPLPHDVREILIKAMHKVITHSQANRGGSLTWVYRNAPKALREYLDLGDQLVGKTSTAEAVENVDLDLQSGTNVYNHIWFGGFSYDPNNDNEPQTMLVKDRFGKPELVIIVYLRYGGYGKEAAPLAAQITKKWREIKKKQQ